MAVRIPGLQIRRRNDFRTRGLRVGGVDGIITDTVKKMFTPPGLEAPDPDKADPQGTNPVPSTNKLKPGERGPSEAAGERKSPTIIPPDVLQAWTATASYKDGRGYGVFRKTQGPNGTWHWGIDLPAKAGSVAIVAPERSMVAYVWKDNNTAPFVGYGPGGVLLQGTVTGVYHLLGHLDPTAWSDASVPTKGQHYDVGELVGYTAPTGSDGVGSAAPHVHWEVRVKPIDSPTTRQGNTLDPLAWLNGNSVTLAPTSSGMPWWLWVVIGLALSRRRR